MTWPGPAESYQAQRREIDEAIHRVLESGQYVLGREVDAFEREFSSSVGTADAVGVASGTDALVLALRALNVQPGDLVLTVSHTAVATVAAIEIIGAVPVLVDIGDDSMTMDPESLSRTLQYVGGAKAVIPVHLYGHPADMRTICSIASQAGAVVVEDCSQAHGATLYERPVGAFGDAGAYSCYPTKNLGAFGDAGILTGNSAFCARVRRIRQYGWGQRYISEEVGINSRLDPVQAAVLRLRLPRLDADNIARRSIASIYDREVSDRVRTPTVAPEVVHAYHQYTVRTNQRDHLAAWLKDRGVPCSVLYPVPVHEQPAYRGRLTVDPAGLPVTEDVCSKILCLPIHPLLPLSSIARVVEAIKKW